MDSDGRILYLIEEPSTNSPTSGIEDEQKRNKNKASCVEPWVNEPKRAKLEQSGPEAGSQIEQPDSETGSKLEQPAAAASRGTKLEQSGPEAGSKIEKPGPQTSGELEQPAPAASNGSGLLRIDSELDVKIVKDGTYREICLTDRDGRQLLFNCILPPPESPKSPEDYGWAPMSPMPTDEEYGLPLEELEFDDFDLEAAKAAKNDIYTLVPKLKGWTDPDPDP
jgi:hypothetical protein